jgi:hypothetical protein
MKICKTCKENKKFSEFHRQAKNPDGLHSECKLCCSLKRKKYRMDNLEKLRAMNRKWYHDNASHAKKVSNEWHKLNPDKARDACKRWCDANPEKVKEKRLKACRKYRSSPRGKLSKNISTGIRNSLCSGGKGGYHWETLVDYTISELKKHLEKQFKSGMSWGNYGSHWHIDHKIPIAVFNYERPDDIDFHLCWSLKNLQPLEKTENLRKNAMLEEPFQPSLAIGLNPNWNKVVK